MTSTITSVVCSECRHENEAERVYCHGCGARLDRAAVKVKKNDPDDARKRVKKLFNPHRARMRMLFFKLSKITLAALGVAAFVQIILPPDVPERSTGVTQASAVGLDLERATSRHQPGQLQYSDDQVNAFLLYDLKTKKKTLDEPLLQFERALVRFGEGSCAVTVERSLFGYSLYTRMDLAPTVSEGRIAVVSKGGSIGRLPVHPQVARFMGPLFGDLWSALEHEKKLVAKMGAVEFHDKTVILTAAP